jgi:hypothetical protein
MPVEVLDDEDGRGKIGGEVREDARERGKAPGRGG